MAAADVASQLLEKVGVCPSSHWLEDCTISLGNDASTDAVLQQILHHDLRDVVREFNDASPRNLQAVALHQALNQSLSSDNAVDLPASFQLLMQVEEFVDVSVNAQLRLAHGPTDRTAPTPVGNQRNRCLKMVVSDGYDNETPMLALEISPIETLSAQSYAGLKVMVRGPMQVRHGVMLWTPGNVSALGGHVEALVEIQQAAIKQAQRVAGIGVDATVRALIGNQGDLENQEPTDEAEVASRDVAAAQQRQVPNPTRIQARDPTGSLQNRYEAPPRPSQPPLSSLPAVSAVVARQRATRSPIPQQPQPSRPTQQSGNPYGAQRGSQSIPQSIPRPANPYAGQPVNSAPQQASPPAPSQVAPGEPSNPYSNTTVNAVSVNDAPMNQANTTPVVAPLSPNPKNASSPYPSSIAASSEQQQSRTVPSSSQQSSVSSQTAMPRVRISFADLQRKAERAKHDPAILNELKNVIYVVELRQAGPKTYFNIDKRRKRRKGIDKKYEYVMGATFNDTGSSSSPCISIRVSSEILEPHFSLPPSDMRALSKKDKASANGLVREGGKSVQQDLQKRWLYEVSVFDGESTQITFLLLKKVI